MRVVDVFCGAGGASCGFTQYAEGCVVLGIDCDERALKSWAANTGGKACCVSIGSNGETGGEVAAVPWPSAAPDLFVHLSPPCTALSKARAGSAAEADVAKGVELLKWSLDCVLAHGYDGCGEGGAGLGFSIENVSTGATRAVAESYASRHPTRIAFTTIDCADYGVPQSRVRLIISTPRIIRALKEVAVRRLTIADAFAAAGVDLPTGATHVKSNSNNRDGSSSLRSIYTQSFTLTASHPLAFSDAHGTTIRCLTVAESAVLQIIPSSWQLPKGSRAGIHAVGNAVPPPVAICIMRCAVLDTPTCTQTPIDRAPAALPAAPPSRRCSSPWKAQVRKLKRRVAALEAAVLAARTAAQKDRRRGGRRRGASTRGGGVDASCNPLPHRSDPYQTPKTELVSYGPSDPGADDA